MSETDYKAKCDELAAKNVELTAQVASLEAVAGRLKQEVQKWRSEFDNTVAIHNHVRDEMMTRLTDSLSFVSNTRFLNSAELDHQRAQAAAVKAKQDVG